MFEQQFEGIYLKGTTMSPNIFLLPETKLIQTFKSNWTTKMLTKKKVRNNTIKANEPIQRSIGRKWNNITLLIPRDQNLDQPSVRIPKQKRNRIEPNKKI